MIIFSWEAEDPQALLRSCETDDVYALIQRHIPLGSRILESGCGLARYVRFLKDQGWHPVGLEYVPETVAAVRKLWPDLDIVCGDATCSPFDADSFDAVLSLGVVEHWTEGPQTPLKDIFRVLKPGGIAIITVPCFNLIRRIKQQLWWYELTGLPRAAAKAVLRHQRQPMLRLQQQFLYHVFPAYGKFFEYRMRPQEFAAEIAKAGFTIVAQQPTALMDGIYHEVNLFHGLVGFKNWHFTPSRLGRWLNTFLSRWPYVHPHMQAIVARKPGKA